MVEPHTQRHVWSVSREGERGRCAGSTVVRQVLATAVVFGVRFYAYGNHTAITGDDAPMLWSVNAIGPRNTVEIM